MPIVQMTKKVSCAFNISVCVGADPSPGSSKLLIASSPAHSINTIQIVIRETILIRGKENQLTW